MGVLLVLVQLFQLVVIVLAHLGMARELQALYVRPAKVWNMYLSVVICFSALYFTFFCFQRSSFQLDGYAASGADDVDSNDPDGAYEDLQTANDIPTIFVYFCYFSGAIMTSVGVRASAMRAAHNETDSTRLLHPKLRPVCLAHVQFVLSSYFVCVHVLCCVVCVVR